MKQNEPSEKYVLDEETDETLEEVSDVEIGNLPERKFRIMLTKMI